MSGTTTTWAIPFATGTDRLCDGDSIIEAMAERIDTILQGFEDSIEMFSVRAYAQVKTGPVVDDFSLQSLYLNVFDQVLGDTNNMVNLSLAPSVISIPAETPGVYLTGSFGSGLDNLAGNANTYISEMIISAADGYALFASGYPAQAWFQNTGATLANGAQPATFMATGLTTGLPGSSTTDIQIFSYYAFAGASAILTTVQTRMYAIRLSAAF